MVKTKFILAIIVLAQFCGTSLWFASNAVMPALITSYQLPVTALGTLTSAIQFGFIIGTFIFALLTVADRFSPSKIFLICALFGAVFNYAIIFDFNTYHSLIAFRSFTGICLAGIYPVGMKIAADHFEKGLGKSLGFLVGALVLGTAFPHILKPFADLYGWKELIGLVSLIAIAGGALLFIFVTDGPFRNPVPKFRLNALTKVFKPKALRTAAFGYFGHMWELYAFWAFVPILIFKHQERFDSFNIDLSILYFLVIGAGSLGCVLAGYLAPRFGTSKIAFSALSISGICCLLTPIIFFSGSSLLFIILLAIWGISVVADSPLFSTLVAQNATPELKGTALTIVNSIGFAITIVSIQLVNEYSLQVDIPYLFCFLAIGPVLGITNYLRA